MTDFYFDPDALPALHGLITALPLEGKWTAERRQAWLDVFVTVLDHLIEVEPS